MGIRRVKEFRLLGSIVMDDRNYQIYGFPTRASIVLKDMQQESGYPSSIKMTIRELRQKLKEGSARRGAWF